MRRGLGVLAALAAWFGASAAAAQDFCADLRGIVAAARTEFVGITGAPIQASFPDHIAAFEGGRTLAAAGRCVVARVSAGERRTSTSYTCAPAGPDTGEGLQTLATAVAECMGLHEWGEQAQADRRGAWVSQYGLIRISITRHGSAGLALGVEVFRDEQGRVLGSTTRGGAVDGAGVHRCQAKSPEEIAGLFAMYAQRPGAEAFQDGRFFGYRNTASHPTVVFMTRPHHPAHPALIVRDVVERDGDVIVTAAGDFAGDCQAFLDLLDEVRRMNEGLRPQR